MNGLIAAGATVVTAALAAYSVSMVLQAAKRRAAAAVLAWQTAAVTLDVLATILMIAGSRRIPITIHGVIGYTALGLMLVDTVLLWGHRRRNGARARFPPRLFRFSIACYAWWVVVYSAGVIIAMRLAGKGG